MDRARSPLSRDFAGRIAAIETAIFRAVGHDFNIGSTKQLGDVLFEQLGLPGGKKGKTGAYGTDASILEELAPLDESVVLGLDAGQRQPGTTDADGRIPRTSASRRVASDLLWRWRYRRRRFRRTFEPQLEEQHPAPTQEGRRIRRAFVAEPGHLLRLPITARSSCGSPPMSPTFPNCGRRFATASTSMR